MTKLLLPLLLLALGTLNSAAYAGRANANQNKVRAPASRSDASRTTTARSAARARATRLGTTRASTGTRRYQPRAIDPLDFRSTVVSRPTSPAAPVFSVLAPTSGRGAILIERASPASSVLGTTNRAYASIRLGNRKYGPVAIDAAAYTRVTLRSPPAGDGFGFDLLVPRDGKSKVYIERTGRLAGGPQRSELTL